MKLVISFLLLSVIALTLFYSGNKNEVPVVQNLPKPMDEDEEENKEKRKLWFELIHKAAPGVNWREIEAQNENNSELQRNNYLANKALNTAAESFASGALQGNWQEKGSDNQAGRNTDAAYDSTGNLFYAISNNGTMWRKSVSGGNWLELNKNLRFSHSGIRIVKNAAGMNRILAARAGQFVYSDNEGLSFTPAIGISNPLSIIALTDALQTIYCLCPDGLYRSINLGQSFTKIFTISASNQRVSITRAHNSNQLYLLDNATQAGSLKLFSVSGATVIHLNTGSIAQNSLPTILRSVLIGSNITHYALIDGNKVYRSIDNGASWTLQGTTPGWSAFEISMDDPQKVFVGGVEASRSFNSGVGWTIVNTWGAYYSDPANRLHADIMSISTYRKPDGSTIYFINTDGGTYISTNDLQTVTNISLTSLRNSEYYDVTTDPDEPNYLFAGSQDQGFQRNITATTPGVLNFSQVISGDYGYITFSGNPKHMWTQYPGGAIYYYHSLTGGVSTTFTMQGTQKPNYAWMLPMVQTHTGRNEVLMAGGNLTGGSGSYLAKLTALTNAPYTITGTQFNYNFKANSNGGGITAIETVRSDTNRIYVATEDGTFFYSTDGGNSWNKSASFSGPAPWYLYGSSIYASRLTPNLIWYAGSGYSNPGVYKSTNGGQTFTAINSGLPSTHIYQIVSNPTETMLFAGTEAGPYVYLVSTNQWYPMLGTNNPLHAYICVEYIDALNIVRFGTYGRGIWDFEVTNSAPPTPRITGTNTICANGNTVLKSSWNSANQWYLNGNAIGGATDSVYTATLPGTYTVVSTGNGLQSNASEPFELTLVPSPSSPVVTAEGPTAICEGNKVTLNTNLQTSGAGNGIQFNGINNFISITNPVGNTFTIEAWIKTSANSLPGSAAYQGNGLIWADITGFSSRDFAIAIVNNKLYFDDGDGNRTTAGTTLLNDNNWHHIAVVRNGQAGTTGLYVDGNLEGSNLAGSQALNQNPVIALGGNPLDNRYFNGQMDEVRIWNSARTQQQLAENMNRTILISSTSLAAYYKMDEGSGTATRNSVNNQKGSFQNSPVWVSPSSLPLNPVAAYQWYKDNVAIGNSAESSFKANASGIYTVKIFSSEGCTSAVSSPIAVTVNPVPPKPTITLAGTILKSTAAAGNQWFLNGVLISGATDSVWVPVVSGQYTVKTTVNGCSSEMSNAYNFTFTSVVAPSWSNELNIYPVPVQQQLYIKASAARPYKVMLFDAKGSLLKQGRFTTTWNSNMSGLPAGSYILCIINERTNERFQRMISKN